ncbi:MAG: [FeFe] hydrogenase H-cluster radical SAM maturase HydG, partial [Candidatus Omnitrophica bacterium]|nr:[FeFe] hydrogenase H-cluster radical SAM maturase HydG [Candidatus Omnitrophota bacterium]
MLTINTKSIINETEINNILEQTKDALAEEALDIIEKARLLKGLSIKETAVLLNNNNPEVLKLIFSAARFIKKNIYGQRLVIFAPLYTANYCVNNCLYCGFRKDNTEMKRRVLSYEEIAEEVSALEEQGHKRLLMLMGDYPEKADLDYFIKAIEQAYKTKSGKGEIRRINVEISPLSVEEFSRLKAADIGTYVLFQETYHRQTYAKMHPCGPKRDYDFRITAMDRAQEAGIDDVGIGVLFGLYDYKFEILALLQHAEHLEHKFGVGPHTISVPRLEPADNAPVSTRPPYPVSDIDFMKLT